MSIRDKIKDSLYFDESIATLNKTIDKINKRVASGDIDVERLDTAKYEQFHLLYIRTLREYSRGGTIESVKAFYKSALNMMVDGGWPESCTKIKLKNNQLGNQYFVEQHSIMLRMLSLGILFKISRDDFQKLVDLIDNDGVTDILYERLIEHYFPERAAKSKEEYDEKHSVILKVFNNLRNAVSEGSPENKESLIQEYMKKDFYHKHCGFFRSHLSEHKIYNGYWCFEAAAFTCILGLNDDLYKNHKYYPKDLVSYFSSQD